MEKLNKTINTRKTIESYLAAQTDIQRSIILKLSSFDSLEDLVDSLDLDEKIELAKNPSITEDIMFFLVNERNINIVTNMLKNPNLSHSTLLKIGELFFNLK